MSMLDNLLTQFQQALTWAVQIVTGDDQTDVTTPGGTIPSFAKQVRLGQEQIAAITPDLTSVKSDVTQLQLDVAQLEQDVTALQSPTFIIRTTFLGTITPPVVGVARWYPDRDITVIGVSFTLSVPHTTGTLDVDVLKDGTSILGGTHPQSAANANKSNAVVCNAPVTSNDYLTINITGDGAGAQVLTVTITYK